MKKIVITSGYFNPLHGGHVNLFREAKKLGDFLVVIVNNDEQVKIKGSSPFMLAEERSAIVGDLRHVDSVFLSIDKTKSIAESLKAVALQYKDHEIIFAKGGDRNVSNIPDEERQVCEAFNIKIIDGIGGDKKQSSSWLLNNVKNQKS